MATAKAPPDPLELELRYSPHRPEPPQHAYLLLDGLGVEEALYGGAAGGGKSDALLMAALRYTHVPGYAALLLRRSYPDLALPGAIMDRAKTWLAGTDARWSSVDFRFTFPSTASLSFGYLATSSDRYRYASAEFQFIGFDELTQFDEADYTFLFSRLRRPEVPDDAPDHVRQARAALAQVPLRMRTASNPGGRGHVWVKRRFVDRLPNEDDPEDTPDRARRRIFIPAKLDDNPHIDRSSYDRMLANLTDVERKRLRHGDWNADDGTLYFDGNGLDACVALGDEYAELAKRTAGAKGRPPSTLDQLPQPVGGKLPLATDWGDHTHGLLGFPLEAGGLWVVAGVELEGLEPGSATDRILELLDQAPAWVGRPRVRDPISLVSDWRYDAAGLQSMRTATKRARARRPDLPTTAIPFGGPMGKQRKGYKRETALYLKSLVERARDGHRTRILAISAGAARVLDRQLRGLAKDPKDRELWVKEDDHGPDALVALAAPIAKRNRGKTPPPKPTPAEALRPRRRQRP